jgi:predicted aspartyl protease
MYKHFARAFGLLALVFLQSATACAQLVHTGPPPPDRVELRARATVAMETFHGLPTVELRMNGKGPYRFVLDTGAHGTVLSNDLGRELGLPDMGQALAGPPGSTAPVPATITRIEELDLGDAQAFGVFAVMLDISKLWHGSDSPRGVLSAASFPGLLLTFNYPEKLVELERGALPAADGQSIFEWSAGEPLPSVPLSVNDLALTAHVDTGSSAGISLPTKYAVGLHFLGKVEKSGTMRSVGGSMAASTATLDGSVRIGRFTIKNPKIRLVEGLANANVGSDFLKGFAVTLDAKNRRIRLESKPAP